ncbi:MAG: hypothetical protein ACKO03_09450 [Bacteroidota bacterium]
MVNQNEIHPIAKKGQTIRYAHSGPEMAHPDLALIRNIFINLISNAMH